MPPLLSLKRSFSDISESDDNSHDEHNAEDDEDRAGASIYYSVS
jgi:hypothetical protein